MLQTLRDPPYSIQNEGVLQAMAEVPRDAFVPEDWQHAAYEDRALPIGHDQTISQPYIVAFMTQLLDPQPSDRVLEIGTGSGYQTAILAQLAAHVYSVEIVGELVRRAQVALEALGIANESIRHGDGADAWVEKAPFERIMVTCAPRELPQLLRDQLADGGRLVYPAGAGDNQYLFRMDRKQGIWRTEKQFAVRFVPMTDEVREG